MNKPCIRFNSSSKDWEQKKVKDIVENISTGKLDANASVKNGKYKFFTCSKDDYLTNTYSFEGDAIIINGNGDLGIVKTYSGKFDAYQRTYVLMKVNEDYDFIARAIEKYLPDRIRTEAIGGAMPYIKLDTIEDLVLNIPEKTEQKEISSFLNNISSIIEIKNRELKLINNIKQTMLIKMFPKNDSQLPEIRFKRFKDKWAINEFVSKFDKLNNNSFSRDDLNYKNGKVKNIHYGDVLIKFGFSIDANRKEVPFINNSINVNVQPQDYLVSGDVVFADTAEDTTAGKAVEIINSNAIKVISGLHTYACRPKEQFAPGYLGILLNTPYFHNQLIPFMQGTKVTGFNYSIMDKIYIAYPSYEEQKRIADFFYQLDINIDSREKEIDNLMHLKETLLSKMFC